MKNIKIYTPMLLALLLLVLGGCKKNFEELSINPNKPSTVPASLLLNGILYDVFDSPYGSNDKWAQHFCSNYDYYGNNRYDFGEQKLYYSTLNNVLEMEKRAKSDAGSDKNPYAALGKFFRAYFFLKMSLQVGDIPMSEALKGVANLTPKFDTQKDVFIQSLKLLDDANNDLTALIASNNQSLVGDFYFGNNLKNWQKTVNSFRIRTLISLSKRVDDNKDMNVKQQFSDILGNPAKYPVFTSTAEGLQFKYNDVFNKYPSNKDNFGNDANRLNASATYIELLTTTKDPRVFLVADPAPAKVAAGTSPTSFDAFIGASSGEDIGVMFKQFNNGEYSPLGRKRYYDTYNAENTFIIGYPELCFNIAEGINRGWAASGALGDAEAYYKEGITASMNFYQLPTDKETAVNVFFLKKGGKLGEYDQYSVTVNFANFYAQPAVKYAGNTPSGLTQILNQKYIAFYMNSGLEAFYSNRRTGVPTFRTGPGNGNGERIAKRFKYPSIQSTANPDNYQAALQSQYGGNDDINASMWLIK